MIKEYVIDERVNEQSAILIPWMAALVDGYGQIA